MMLSVFEEAEGFRNVTITIPMSKYRKLQEAARTNSLSISKLAKEGIDSVLKEYEKKSKKI